MHENKKVNIKAHGKVILIGEHSVVYGKDALALPINALNITTTVENNSKNWMDTNHYHGPFLDAPAEYDGLKYVFKTLLEKSKSDEKVKITYSGEIPIERGLGSSAAVALGTTKALNEYFNLNLSEEEIMNITNHAEMINHGKASGLDAATVHSDYLVFFNKQDGPQTLKDKLGATLLIMDTGELGNTKQAVSSVRKQYEENDTNKQKIDRLGQLATQTRKIWSKHDSKTVGQIFNEAQEILSSFGLSTNRIDNICKIAQENGALGSKLSGGGLGGIVIALCPSQEIAQQISQKAQNYFSNYWIEEI
ncbi:mevalonate kinase [uncultured Lactobacillus sp.]|uniref:mevalonate kinase n=1 Tax=uncultured Lactobacillus sp. TaxID=153152 RepID=UPI00263862EB|nr:mevalonate kinase [uncultured Lactobacillus sp.]